MNKDEKKKLKRTFKFGYVALVGETNAGKSTLLNALMDKKVSIVTSKAHTTRNRIQGIKNSPSAQVVYVDTPGFVQKKRATALNRYTNKILEESTEEVDLFLLVIDADIYARKLGKVAGLVEEYQGRFSKTPAIIVLNKVDIVNKGLLLPLIGKIYSEFNIESERKNEIPVVPVSAWKKDSGINQLSKLIEEKLPEGEPMFPTDIISDQEEDFFVAEIIREKIFASLRQELPYSVAVRVIDWKEEGNLLRLAAEIYVERDSQKSIVIGKGASALKKIGQEARIELEQLYQCKVFLELFVKVEEKWTENVRGLQKVGYE